MMEDKIIKFIKRHHVMTLATVSEGQPYCANAFYGYDKERNRIVFTSDLSTRHTHEILQNSRVAASIVLETRIVGKIQGLQICGSICSGDDLDRRCYIKRFPYAALADLTLWALEPDFIKLTDNTLGFGKKIIWNK